MTASRARPLIELLAMNALVALDLWLPWDAEFQPLRWLARAAAAALWILSFRRRGRDRTKVASAGRAWTEAALMTAVIAAILIAWLTGTRESYDEPALTFLGSTSTLATWSFRRFALAALQQLFLQLFFFAVLREVLRPAPAALAAATLFGLCHLPSTALAIATFLAALVWIALYRRSRRLAPVILSHAILAALASITVPERLFYELRAGARAVESLPTYRLLAGRDTRALLRQVTSDDYFDAHGGTDRGYLRALFRDLLGRPAAPDELTRWIERTAHTSRPATARALITSAEALAAGPFEHRLLDYRPLKPGVQATAGEPLRYPAASIAWVDGPYFLEGFSIAEQNLRWTQELIARLVYPIRRVARERPYVVRLTAGAHGRQKVEVVLNGKSIARFELEGITPQVRTARFDDALLHPGANIVELRIPNAAPTGDDPRHLGLAFVTLSIQPVAEGE